MTVTLNDVHRLVMDAVTQAQDLGLNGINRKRLPREALVVRTSSESICKTLNNALNAIGSIQLAQMSKAQAVLALAGGRAKVSQDLACDFGAAVTEDDDGVSTLYEFADGSRLRIRLSAHVVERAQTW